jgi:hypothetical protein
MATFLSGLVVSVVALVVLAFVAECSARVRAGRGNRDE